MTPQEIQEKWAARKFETQAEFEAMMVAINNEQTEANAPLIDKDTEFSKMIEALKARRSELDRRIAMVRIDRLNLMQEQKAINRAYHKVKHDLIVLNPKCCLQPGTMPKERPTPNPSPEKGGEELAR